MLNTILGSLSAAGVPNSYESIATVNPTSGSVTFTSIPSTYTHLQIRAIWRSNYAGVADGFMMRFNGVATDTYTSHYLRGDGSSATSGTDASIPNNGIRSTLMPGGNATSGVFGAAIIDILDYANTNKNKTVRFLAGFDNNGSGRVGLGSGFSTSTSAITSLSFFPNLSNDFVTYTSVALYGIKGA